MELMIDNRPCDIDEKQAVSINYDAGELSDIESGREGVSLQLQLPSTPTNDQIFRFAADPYTGSRFNDTAHRGALKCNGATLMTGYIRLLQSETGPEEAYIVELICGTAEWAQQAATEMFNTLGIDFSERLTPMSIVQSWTNDSPVKFFPVHRDDYTPELSSTELLPVERLLSADDYHPFIALSAIVEAIFSETGYTIESKFMKSEFFRSLYMSGAYVSRNTNAVRNHMDFFARRKTTAASTANSAGRVYASPFRILNSVGNFVETVNPNDTNDLGEPLTDVFSNNHCFTIKDGEIQFAPITSVTTGFEYHIRYITAHRILSRTRLRGFDSVYLGDGTDLELPLANRYVDRRDEIKPYFQYRAIVFDHTDGNAYRLTCTRDGSVGYVVGEFSSRTARMTTPAADAVSAPKLLYKPAGSSAYTVYPGDWALYDGYIEETGQTEVEMTIRTNPVTVTPSSPKTFSTIYFYGAEEGMSFQLSRECTLRPDFSSAPGLNTQISFQDIGRHSIHRIVVLEALQHLFNLRFYTDTEAKKVYIEPRDDFFKLGTPIDWSEKIDHTHPILLSDMAQEIERVRIYKFREADGAVRRLNNTLEEPLGEWHMINNSAATINREKSLPNPPFSATVNETEHYPNAPSASIMQVGDRDDSDASDRWNFTPRIVRYCGMHPLPENEQWGFPSNGTSYPLAAFLREDADEGFTLGFEDRYGHSGLNRYYTTQTEQQHRCQYITLYLRLEPHEIESLFQIQKSVPCIASNFRFQIGGESVLCTLQRIEEYDPRQPSTRCVFARQPNR